MPTYNWLCHVCKTSNRAGVETCQACGFAAVASGVDIEAATNGRTTNALPTRNELEEIGRKEFADLPLWKKAIARILRGLQIVGSVIFAINLFGLAWDGMLFGLAILVVTEILYQMLTSGQGCEKDLK
jgi:hypothetical protein